MCQYIFVSNLPQSFHLVYVPHSNLQHSVMFICKYSLTVTLHFIKELKVPIFETNYVLL